MRTDINGMTALRRIVRITSAILTAIALSAALYGCSLADYPELPDDAIAFRMGEYIDYLDDGAAYGTIEYEGRLYLPYGTLRGSVGAKDTDRCVGYIVMDENSSSMPDPDDRDTRIYTLAADPEHNYLMERYNGSNIMGQPFFWRAADTRGKDEIRTPDYIDSLGYEGYWNR